MMSLIYELETIIMIGRWKNFIYSVWVFRQPQEIFSVMKKKVKKPHWVTIRKMLCVWR